MVYSLGLGFLYQDILVPLSSPMSPEHKKKH